MDIKNSKISPLLAVNRIYWIHFNLFEGSRSSLWAFDLWIIHSGSVEMVSSVCSYWNNPKLFKFCVFKGVCVCVRERICHCCPLWKVLYRPTCLTIFHSCILLLICFGLKASFSLFLSISLFFSYLSDNFLNWLSLMC